MRMQHRVLHETVPGFGLNRYAANGAAPLRYEEQIKYVHRFTEIFARMGLPTRPVAALLSNDVLPAGNVEYVAA